MEEKLESETNREKYEKPTAIDIKTAAANGDFPDSLLGTPCSGTHGCPMGGK
jgi:hypothetical protein